MEGKFKGLLFIVLLVLAGASHPDYRDGLDALKSRNYSAALAEFNGLAKLGLGKASRQYAALLEKGRGTNLDPVEAYAWYLLAIQQGDQKAAKQAKKLDKKLTPAQLGRGTLRHDELARRYSPDVLDSLLLAEEGGRRPYVYSIEESKCLKWPPRHRDDGWAAIVMLEFDVDPQGRLQDFQLIRQAPKPYVDEAIRCLRLERLPSNQNDRYAVSGATLFYYTDADEQYGQARLLRKLRKRAKSGSAYNKYFYALAQEISERLGNRYSAMDSNDWYLASAKEGYAKSQYVIGQRMFHGVWFRRNEANGLRWLHQAAQRGSASANYFLARHQHTQQADGSASLMRKAADLGHTTAMLRVAEAQVKQGNYAAALEYLHNADAHLDRISWLETAQVVYASDAPQKVISFQQEADALKRASGN